MLMATAFFRTIILYLLLIAGLRLTGKRQIGELEPIELVLTMLLSDLASVPMQDFGIPLLNGVVPILALIALSTLFSCISLRNVRFRSLVCGEPALVIRDGRIRQEVMHHNRLTLDELMEIGQKLTVEGEQFKDYAEKVITLTNASLSEISSLHKYENHLRIGCSDSIYEGHLAPIILEHRRQFPNDALKITIGLSNLLMDQLQNDIFDVIFTYLPMKKSSYHCEVYKQDKMILVTDYYNTMYARGITKQALIAENYLMCNFALQDVGQFIRNLFPRYHQFSLEIDDCSKIIPFLLGSESYTFLPADTARPFLEAGKLRVIPLLDLETPVINSYMICKNSKRELCQSIFM